MKTTALIPAYNEEKTIGAIVSLLHKSGVVDEVVVVDDGSLDMTARVAAEAGAHVISLEENQGKGAALERGIRVIEEGIILMLDGDLIGLKKRHLLSLLTPLLEDEAEMTVGVFNSGRGITDLAQLLTPNLSGQRAVKKEVLKGIRNLKNKGFGVEIAINRYVKKRGRIKFVELPHLTHLMKEEKRGTMKGIIARINMYWDIIKVFFNDLTG